MSFIARRATRIGGRNKFALVALAIAGYVLFSKSAQERAGTGIGVLSGIGTAFDSTLRNFIPLDVFGDELKGFGEGFFGFSTNVSGGVKALFSPITDLIEWIVNLPSLTVKTTTTRRVVEEEESP